MSKFIIKKRQFLSYSFNIDITYSIKEMSDQTHSKQKVYFCSCLYNLMIENQTNQYQDLQILIKSSLLGAARAFITLPLQHPFDTIKTNMQAYSQQATTVIYHIYHNKGVKGFYNGFFVNTIRVMAKQMYRWPLMIGVSSFYTKHLKWSQVKSSTLTGLTIALLEVGIITPFQRLKCWLMTSVKNERISNFLLSETLFSLFQGFTPVFIKQSISWVTFLASTTYFKELFKRIYKTQNLTNLQILLVSFPVSLVNTFFVMPIDYIKTQYQKQSTASQKEQCKMIYKKFMEKGIRQFYIGWQIKIIQYSINSIFTVTLLQSLMKDYQSKA